MSKNKYLFLAFVVVIAVVLINRTLTDAALIMSLLVYIFILAKQVEKRGESTAPEQKLAKEPAAEVIRAPIAEPATIGPLDADPMHGQEFVAHYAYTDPGATGAVGCDSSGQFCGTVYNSHVDIPHGTTVGVDQANVEMARRRARDRQALEGQVAKDVNYYRYHFANELDESEKKRWWGNHEY